MNTKQSSETILDQAGTSVAALQQLFVSQEQVDYFSIREKTSIIRDESNQEMVIQEDEEQQKKEPFKRYEKSFYFDQEPFEVPIYSIHDDIIYDVKNVQFDQSHQVKILQKGDLAHQTMIQITINDLEMKQAVITSRTIKDIQSTYDDHLNEIQGLQNDSYEWQTFEEVQQVFDQKQQFFEDKRTFYQTLFNYVQSAYNTIQMENEQSPPTFQQPSRLIYDIVLPQLLNYLQMDQQSNILIDLTQVLIDYKQNNQIELLNVYELLELYRQNFIQQVTQPWQLYESFIQNAQVIIDLQSYDDKKDPYYLVRKYQQQNNTDLLESDVYYQLVFNNSLDFQQKDLYDTLFSDQSESNNNVYLSIQQVLNTSRELILHIGNQMIQIVNTIKKSSLDHPLNSTSIDFYMYGTLFKDGLMTSLFDLTDDQYNLYDVNELNDKVFYCNHVNKLNQRASFNTIQEPFNQSYQPFLKESIWNSCGIQQNLDQTAQYSSEARYQHVYIPQLIWNQVNIHFPGYFRHIFDNDHKFTSQMDQTVVQQVSTQLQSQSYVTIQQQIRNQINNGSTSIEYSTQYEQYLTQLLNQNCFDDPVILFLHYPTEDREWIIRQEYQQFYSDIFTSLGLSAEDHQIMMTFLDAVQDSLTAQIPSQSSYQQNKNMVYNIQNNENVPQYINQIDIAACIVNQQSENIQNEFTEYIQSILDQHGSAFVDHFVDMLTPIVQTSPYDLVQLQQTVDVIEEYINEYQKMAQEIDDYQLMFNISNVNISNRETFLMDHNQFINVFQQQLENQLGQPLIQEFLDLITNGNLETYYELTGYGIRSSIRQSLNVNQQALFDQIEFIDQDTWNMATNHQVSIVLIQRLYDTLDYQSYSNQTIEGYMQNEFKNLLKSKYDQQNHVQYVSKELTDLQGFIFNFYGFNSTFDKSIFGIKIKEYFQESQFKWNRTYVDNFFQKVQLSIGQQVVQKYDNMFLMAYNKYHRKQQGQPNFDRSFLGHTEEALKFTKSKQKTIIWIPLIFWYCLHFKNSIPLVSLKNQEQPTVTLEVNSIKDLVTFTSDNQVFQNEPTIDIKVYQKYIKLKSVEHVEQLNYLRQNMLIEQFSSSSLNPILNDLNGISNSFTFHLRLKKLSSLLIFQLKYTRRQNQNELKNIFQKNQQIRDRIKQIHILINDQKLLTCSPMHLECLLPINRQLSYNNDSDDETMMYTFAYPFSLNYNKEHDMQPRGQLNMGQIEQLTVILEMDQNGYSQTINQFSKHSFQMYVHSCDYNMFIIASGQSGLYR